MKPAVLYEKDLNKPQLEAVTHEGSPLLVLAGAGSGKTRVITYRISHLVGVRGVPPGQILAVTFTNKAAGEMKERIQSLLDERADIWIRTFHSTAARLLRIMGTQLGVRADFTIIDQQDQNVLVKRVMKDLKIDPEQFKPEKYAYLIERAKDNLLDAEGALKANFSSDALFYEIYRAYEEKLDRENLCDFGDLIARLVKALGRSEGALAALKSKFRHVLIDEFQDTNFAQYSLVKQLTLPEGNVCVVGDDDQSIYGFRGAKVENILNFPNDFKGTRIIKLEQNYRSFQTILSASTHVINHNSDRLGKTLFTDKGSGDKITFIRAQTDYGEALAIAEEIARLSGAADYRYSDIAVFYRMNAQSRVFESVFSQMRIPYVIVGGLRFYEREEIKDMLAYLRLCLNPFDEVSLRRIANKPPRGIGEKTVDAWVSSTIDLGVPLFGGGRVPELSFGRARLASDFIGFLEELGRRARSSQPQRVVRHLYDSSGYLEWLEREGKEEKRRNLEELYNAVEEFAHQKPDAPIAEFIEEASLNQGFDDEETRSNRVFLITLHNAKGLEFPVVFMAGMEEGVFPHFLSGERIKDLQEERRLCYVGMTRAKERLYMSAARVRKLYGRSVERSLSAFMSEVPKELLRWKEQVDRGWFSRRQRAEPAVSNGRGPGGGARIRRSAGFDTTSDLSGELAVHSRVVHKSFGRGMVVATDGDIAEILFDDGKKMKFMLKYTPLSKE